MPARYGKVALFDVVIEFLCQLGLTVFCICFYFVKHLFRYNTRKCRLIAEHGTLCSSCHQIFCQIFNINEEENSEESSEEERLEENGEY